MKSALQIIGIVTILALVTLLVMPTKSVPEPTSENTIRIFSEAKADIVTRTASWDAYTPTADHELHLYCSTGTPTDADFIVSAPADQTSVQFTMDANPGDTITCYLRARRISDDVFSIASTSASYTLPVPPVAPTGLSLQ